MISDFKDIFNRPSALVIAQRELEEAKRQHLSAASQAEYNNLMVEYYEGVIRRLTDYITKET